VVETVVGDEDRIEMARPCCIISTGSGLEKIMRPGDDGALGYHMDAEMALTEASFLAPDDDSKASYLLHTSADEEEERKALLKQMRAHDQMHILVDRPQRQKSLVHCEPTNRQALDTQVRHRLVACSAARHPILHPLPQASRLIIDSLSQFPLPKRAGYEHQRLYRQLGAQVRKRFSRRSMH